MRRWPGETVVILGGGPSLTGTAVRTVARARAQRRCKVLAVNDAVYLAWWADWLHAADAKWWHANIEYLRRFEGTRSTSDDIPPQWQAFKYERTGVRGYDRRPGKIRGNNSGYQALHCAGQAGAAKVVLVGFDMRPGHWFEGPADTVETDYAGVMVPHFELLRRRLHARGTEVVNCSPGSALECFPFEDLSRALAPTGIRTGAASLAPSSLPGLH